MSNAKEQISQIEEMSDLTLQDNSDDSSHADDEEEEEEISTVIKKIRNSKYMSLSTVQEKLNENNWADWTRHVTPILKVCEV
jgi:hypothetical protein